jgi:hypothetical protein
LWANRRTHNVNGTNVMTIEAFEIGFICLGLRCPRLRIRASSLFLELSVSEIVISRLAP